jgi:hypothetical protein
MGSANTGQQRFWWRQDNGTETTASFRGALGTPWSPAAGDLDTPQRIRFELGNTGGMDESSGSYNLYYDIDNGGYNPLTTSSSKVKLVSSAQSISDDDTTSEQMSGAQTFQAGRYDETGSSTNITIVAGQETEVEFCIQFDSATITGGEVIKFQVYRDTSALDSYANTPSSTLPTPPVGTIEQGVFRWRPEGAEEAVNDNSAGDWEAATSVDVTLDMMAEHGGLLTRLRVELKETASGSKTITPKLQYRKNGGSWITPRDWNYIDPGSEIGTYDQVMIVNKETTTDGAATSALITSATDFVAGTMEHDATAASVTLGADKHTEIEWAILISRFYNTRQVTADGDYFEFRVVESDDTLLGGTYDYPKVTVNIPDNYIGGTCVETGGREPFIVTPSGTMYMVIEDAELGANGMMLKSTDGGKTWTPVDNSTALTDNDLESFDMVYDDENKVIHCLHISGEANYYQFGTEDHGTYDDQWITGNFTQLNSSIDSFNQSASIVLRIDGTNKNIYCFYADLNSTDQVYYRKKADLTTGTFASEVSIDTSGGSADFSGVMAILGPTSNDIHIFYSDYINYNLYHRTLDTADSLGTRNTISSNLPSNNDSQHGMTNPIAWDNGTYERVMIGFAEDGASPLYTVIVDDGTTVNTKQNATNSVQVLVDPAALNPRQPTATLGIDTSADKAYVIYADDATEDVWRADNADGAGWSNHTEIYDANTAHALRGSVFTHSSGNGGSTVFGVFWETTFNQSGSTPKSGYSGAGQYFEYEISAGGDLTKTVTDTGGGADAISSITAGLSIADAGSAAESFGGQVSLSVAESGSGAEVISLSALIQMADAGAGAGVISFPSIIASVADVAAGADIVQDLQVSLQIPDAGSGSEGLTLAAQLSVADSAIASDVVSTLKQLFKTVNDLASGSDQISDVTVSLSLADAGAGLDALSISALASITDLGSGADDLTDLLASLSVPDVGSASEVPGIAADMAVADSGSASDDPAISADLTIADSGNIIDIPAIAAELSISDSASGLDVIVAYTLIAVADVASAVDGLGSITINLTVPDAGSATEAPTIAADLAVADAGSASENPAISADLSVADIGSASDDLSDLEVGFTIADSGSGAEGNPAVIASLSINDLGSTTETPSMTVALSVSDLGSGSDSIEILSALLKTVTDSASASEAITDITVSASVADTAAGSEALQIAVDLSVADAAGASDVVSTLQATLISITDAAAASDLVSGVVVSLAVADTAATSEAFQIATSLSVADSASGLDSIDVLADILKSIADAGAGSDSISVVSVSLAVPDVASGAEVIDITASLAVSDSGAGLESLLLEALTGISDAGTGSDVVGPIGVNLTVADSGTANEVLNYLISVYKLIADSGSALDSIGDVVVQVPVSDVATASDFVSSVLADVMVADIASGVDVVAQFDSSFNLVAFTFSFKQRTIEFTFSTRTIDFISAGGVQPRTMAFDLTQLEV